MASITRRIVTGLLPILLVLSLTGCPGDEAFVETASDAGLVPIDTGPADTTEVPDTSPQVDVPDVDENVSLICGAPPDPSMPFPAREVGVRITGPTGRGKALYAGTTVTVAGIAFGDIASMTWRRGGQTGDITPAAFWGAPGIQLEPGDNTITVTAVGTDGTERSDTVVLTSRTAAALLGDVRLNAYPSSAVVGETTRTRLSVALELGDIDPEQVNLYRVDADGQDLAPVDVVKLRDDGETDGGERCDAVPGDRVYSTCKTIAPDANDTYCYRVRIGGLPGGQTVESPVTCIDITSRFTAAQCLSVNQLLNQVQGVYDSADSHETGIAAARQALETSSIALGIGGVGEAADGYGVWVRFGNGVLAALPLGIPEGFRASPSSRRAMLHRPTEATDMAAIADRLRTDQCPPWTPEGPLTGGAASLAALRALGSYGVIAFAGHGGAFFDGQSPGAHHDGLQEVWWTGQSIDCSALPDAPVTCTSDADCGTDASCVLLGSDTGSCLHHTQSDIALGRTVLSGNVYGITPTFVDRYADGQIPGAVVWAGACHSAYNGSFAMSFLAGGAATYYGFDGLVRDGFAQAVAERAFEKFITETATSGEAMCYTADPGAPDTNVRLFGSTATTLDTSGIINPGFEELGGAGWAVSGNARQVSSFCGVSPQFGSLMSVASTSLAGAGVSGRFTQTFCIPDGTNNLSFWWRYLTSEPEALCGGDKYADRWTVTLTRQDGTSVEVKSCTREDMCFYDVGLCQPKPCAPPSDCGCGACYQPTEVLEGCTFDGQPVTTTGFIEETFNVSAFAGGGPVTLEIEVLGDSLNASSLILDQIELQ